MGLIDLFKSKTEEVKKTRTALDAANDRTVEEGTTNRAINQVVTMPSVFDAPRSSHQ